ncbi:uncharacterized protein [Solanum tuberosum]|uniref:An Arabidopsis thialiana chromosome BAC genomic sequence n=1 Tax=Solanum tuberosum TaxID=4113 RepID=M1B9C3_SOLTU|nr:PREDICTED: uncharacterized protein LOC102606048 [Solanum tuberosum]KAH0715801.1 hypothetical protein KY284_008706 [Solanum tuberosum]
MASACISNCVNDARAPVRATYVNLYKWPESDAEFIRSVSSKNHDHGHGRGRDTGPKVVDSISCRQLYLRSYTFSREDQVNLSDEKKSHVKCYGKRKRKLPRRNDGGDGGGGGGDSGGGRRRSTRRKCKGFSKAKELSCAALASIFRRLLSCTTKVDVIS